jgi:hypothetical protein
MVAECAWLMLASMKSCLAAGLSLLIASSCSNSWAQLRVSKPVGSNPRELRVEPDNYEFGGALDADEKFVVAALTRSQVEAIDAAILQDVSSRWSKVAMVLAQQLKARPGIPDDVPLEFYWQRLSRLVERGELESQGNLHRARSSEVRRP